MCSSVFLATGQGGCQLVSLAQSGGHRREIILAREPFF
jgi:hypothetical protein